jgi:hypothetical protein
MRNKFIVHDLEKNTSVEYKSLKAVSRVYNADYHQLYQVYLQCMQKTLRKQQPNNDIFRLSKILHIYDNTIDFRQNDREESAAVL